MPLSCQRDFTITVNTVPVAHLTEYWTLQESGNADRVGSNIGIHLPAFPATTEVPALYGNGVRLTTAPVEPGLDQSDSPLLAYNDAASTGLSIWFWIRLIAGPSGFNPQTLAQLTFFDNVGPQFSGITLAYLSQSNIVRVVHFGDVPGSNFQVDGALVPVVGVWHMIAATFDKNTATVNLYIDGVSAGSLADPSTAISGDSGALSIFNAGGVGANAYTADVDEWGISLTGALTAAQVLALYNGGIGVTWPGVKTIVPI